MPLLLVPLFIPFLFFLPGYCIARLFFRNPDALSVGERLFIPIAVSVCITTWLALTLAEFGAFSIWTISILIAALSAILWFVGRKRFAAWSLREVEPDWIFLATLVLAVFLFARPAEYIIGNSDAGTYVNTGANIARTGAIAIHDAQVASLPLDSANTFYWRLTNPFMLYSYVRLPGFFIADPAQGLVLPQFLHLYPAWLALWDSLLGVQLGLYATPLIALLGSIAFFLLARKLFGQNVARLAFFLLVITVPQFWFARYPVAEGMTQFLLLTGMYAVLSFEPVVTNLFVSSRANVVVTNSFVPSTSLGFPLLAGIAFGEIFLARADAILLIAPLGIYALVLIFSRRWTRTHWAFFGAFGVVFGQAIIHMLIFSPDYVYYQYSHALRMKNIDKLLPGGLPEAQDVFGKIEYLGIALGLVILGIVVLFVVDRIIQVLRKRWGEVVSAQFTRSERGLRIVSAIVVVAIAIFGYFLWPRPESLYTFVGGLTPLDRSANLIKLGWYLSPISIVLATIGAVIVLLRDLNRRNAFFFGTAALFTLFYLEELYSNPHYIYTTRHYVPLVIPFFILLAARALQWLWNPQLWWRAAQTNLALQKFVRVGAGGAFALWMLYNLYAMGIVEGSRANGLALRVPFVTHTITLGSVHVEPFEKSIAGMNELGGAYQQIASLAQSLAPNAVVIFSAGRDEPAALATPLRFIFGRDAFVTVFNNPPSDKIATMLDTWRAQGREVVLAYGTNGGKLQIPGYALEHIGDASLDVPQLAFSYDFMPRSAWRVNLSYALFRAVPRTAPEAYPFVLDFGGDDYPTLLYGFLERSPEASTRWSGAILSEDKKAGDAKWIPAAVRIPITDVPSMNIQLRARAPRANVPFQLKSGSNLLGTAQLSSTFADYVFQVDTDALKRNGDGFVLELDTAPTLDGQGRVLGTELESLRVW
ncbi:MAG TPA: hypothetical protein VFD70_20455 [Anaerolineae bacterium]|nr:hypothetical protein [Anaerolineae bacterium]